MAVHLLSNCSSVGAIEISVGSKATSYPTHFTQDVLFAASFDCQHLLLTTIEQSFSDIVWNGFEPDALITSLQSSRWVPFRETLWVPLQAIAAMMSGPDSTPLGRAAAEKFTSNAISPEGSDSGYASIGNTTDGSTTDHSQDFADGVALPSRNFFERKVTKLRLFDKEIPQLTQHRFHDLHELFERPLCDYLIKAKVNPNPISIKLKVLGESEATAKPWIVVLCNKTASKKIRHFFNQPQIKAAYQPLNPDSFLPAFKVFVCNRPPRPMAGTEIYSDSAEKATTCGRIIRVGEAHHSRFATLGGVIKYVFFEPISPLLDQTLRLETRVGNLYSRNILQCSPPRHQTQTPSK